MFAKIYDVFCFYDDMENSHFISIFKKKISRKTTIPTDTAQLKKFLKDDSKDECLNYMAIIH